MKGCLLSKLWGLLIFVPIALWWAGGQALYTVVKNRSPAVLTVDEFATQRSDAKWLQLTGILDISQAVDLKMLGPEFASEIFVPLLSERASPESEVVAMVSMNAPRAIELYKQMERIREERGEVARNQFVENHRSELMRPREIVGSVRYGINMDSGDLRKMKRRHGRLAEHVVVIDEGKRPDGLSIGLLPLGFAAAYLIYYLPLKNRGKTHRTSMPVRVLPKGEEAQPPPLPPSAKGAKSGTKSGADVGVVDSEKPEPEPEPKSEPPSWGERGAGYDKGEGKGRYRR